MRVRTSLLVIVAVCAGLALGRWGLPAPRPTVPDVHETPHDAAESVVWTCSMHPQIRQDGPGACPLCGMDLVRAVAATAGDTLVTLSPSAQRVASIEVTTIGRRPLVHELRAVGRIEFAEPLVAYLTARVAARVERVYADFTGTIVSEGDHLVDIYSPELVLAQQELVVAGPNAAEARRKLSLLGVTDEQIDAIELDGAPRTVLTVHAPIGGTVIEKSVREQMYLDVGDPLYTIADLSTVWMFADVFETDLPWVTVGLPVDVSIEGAPGEVFAGTVAFVEPVVRDATRTVRVRVNLPNPEGRLRPGMFAVARIRAALGADGLRAPSPLAGLWSCPMHPEVAGPEPGACRLCGMDLQRIPDEPAAQHAAAAAHDSTDAHAESDAPDLHFEHSVHGESAPEPSARWVCPMDCDPPRDAPGRCGVCGMFLVERADDARADVAAPPGAVPLLAVPVSAVLDSGLRQIVWVERAPGRYEAAAVRLGPRAGDFHPVLAGLSPGDRVVVRGNFLLDSQAQIEGRPSLLLPHGLEFDGGASAHAGH